MPKVAVVLSGCGRADGSEIHESVSILVHLSRAGAAYHCFAPDQAQVDVVNHATGAAAKESRNCLVESARISRGDIGALAKLDVDGYDAVFFPGGFGAAKNLCTFAKDGADCTVNADVARVIKGFHGAGKPIGLCCIAPVIAARVLGTKLGGPGCSVTIGGDPKTGAAITAMGAKNVETTVTQAHTDSKNRLVTTAAYMCEATPSEIFDGIGKMVDGVLAMCRK